jgi:hypothetical protein
MRALRLADGRDPASSEAAERIRNGASVSAVQTRENG